MKIEILETFGIKYFRIAFGIIYTKILYTKSYQNFNVHVNVCYFCPQKQEKNSMPLEICPILPAYLQNTQQSI